MLLLNVEDQKSRSNIYAKRKKKFNYERTSQAKSPIVWNGVHELPNIVPVSANLPCSATSETLSGTADRCFHEHVVSSQ